MAIAAKPEPLGIGPQPPPAPPLLLAEFGLGCGNALLKTVGDPAIVQQLGRIITRHVRAELVSVAAVANLDGHISGQIAEAGANFLNKQIIFQKLRDENSQVTMSDLEQVMSGATLASRDVFWEVCKVLHLDPEALIEEARQNVKS